MHLADGILSTPACVAAGGLALAGAALAARRIDPDEAPRLGLMGAALFSASLIHIPLAGTSAHLGLYGLAGILLGTRALPVLMISLLLQALLFQHGGLLSLGVNSLNMGLGALAAAAIWRCPRLPESLRALAAGGLGAFLPAVALVLEFQLADYGRGLYVLLAASGLMASVEGALTVAIVAFFRRVAAPILEAAP